MVIYLTVNLINNKKYIGQDSNDNPNYFGSGILLNKAIKKYGKQNFIKIILEKVFDSNKLNQREEFWIKCFKADSDSEFYNISPKGMGYPKGLKSIKQNECKFKEIDQYSLDGKFIKTWSSLKEANNFYNIKVGCITNVLKGKYKSAGGYIWKYKGEKLILPLNFRPNHKTSIIQYDLDGNIIREWESQKEAINTLKLSQSNLSKAINEGKKYKGWGWTYKYL